MKRIPLGQSGREKVIVDDCDYPKLSQRLWHKSICLAAQRRPRVNGKRKVVFMHHEILGLVGKKKRVIHLNGDRLDNRRSNLEIMGKKCGSSQR